MKNVDCIQGTNSLFKINEKYLLINCNNGIGIFYIKTNEIIQYIQKKFNINKIVCDNEENIYIFNMDINNNINNNNRYNKNLSLVDLDYNNNNSFYNKINISVSKILNGSFKIIILYLRKMYIYCFEI